MSRTDQLAAFFKAHPMVWVDGMQLVFAGSYAWRSRLAELRFPPHGMTIENRQRTVGRYRVSEYCYVPPSVPVAQSLPLEANL